MVLVGHRFVVRMLRELEMQDEDLMAWKILQNLHREFSDWLMFECRIRN